MSEAEAQVSALDKLFPEESQRDRKLLLEAFLEQAKGIPGIETIEATQVGINRRKRIGVFVFAKDPQNIPFLSTLVNGAANHVCQGEENRDKLGLVHVVHKNQFNKEDPNAIKLYP